jgi:hypothetical protein
MRHDHPDRRGAAMLVTRRVLMVALTATSAGVACEPAPRAGAVDVAATPISSAAATRPLTLGQLTVQEQSAGQPWSIRRSYDKYRFEVRRGERRQKASERDRPIERSEIQLQQRLRFGVDYAVSYDFRVEPGPPNASAWVNIGQIHATEDAQDAKGLGPLFAVQLAGERMRLVARTDAQRVSVARPRDLWLYRDDADLVRGRWYRMDINLRIAPLGGGRLTVRRDGRELVSYTGPLGYNDALGPYWKLGIYRSTSPEPLAVEFRRFTLKEDARSSAGAAQLGGLDDLR